MAAKGIRQARAILGQEQGVSIVFACLVLAVLMILGGTVLACGYGNYSRSAGNASRAQSYETVSGAAELLHSRLDGKQLVAGDSGYSIQGLGSTQAAPQWLVSLLDSPSLDAVVHVRQPQDAFDDVAVTCVKKGGSGKNASFDIICSVKDSDDGIRLGFTLRLSDATPGLDSDKDGKPDSYTVTLDAQDIGKVRD